jgi:hypothetical protein
VERLLGIGRRVRPIGGERVKGSAWALNDGIEEEKSYHLKWSLSFLYVSLCASGDDVHLVPSNYNLDFELLSEVFLDLVSPRSELRLLPSPLSKLVDLYWITRLGQAAAGLEDFDYRLTREYADIDRIYIPFVLLLFRGF